MTVRLVLISHAATAATRESRFPGDEPLTDREAVEAPRRIETAFRGPEIRCAQTAEALGLDAAAHPLLADLDLGTWRGRTLAELEQEAPADLFAWMGDPGAAPHGGESLTALMDRVARWLADVPEGRVAAVTHPAVVRAAVLLALGAPATCFWRLDTAPLSQTWLSRHGGRWQVRETGHTLR